MKVSNKPNQFEVDENAFIDLPDELDILCGKGRTISNHEGSRRFRNVIQSYCRRYEMSSTRQQKMKITKEIFDHVNRLGSKFLKYDMKTTAWQPISEAEARDKISHALRFAIKVQHQKEQSHHSKNKKSFLSSFDLLDRTAKARPRKKRKGDSLAMESYTSLSSLASTTEASSSFFKTMKRPHHSLSSHRTQYQIDENKKWIESSNYGPIQFGMEGKKFQQKESVFLDPIALDEIISCTYRDGYSENRSLLQQGDRNNVEDDDSITPLPIRTTVSFDVAQLAAKLDDECIQIMSMFR